MKILDYEGLKQVVGKIKGLIDKKADKADLEDNIKFHDTRDKDESPAWYVENYTNKLIKEFKKTETIGIKEIVNTDYCLLITMMGLNIENVGYPIQICLPTINTKIFYRIGFGDEYWSNWQRLLDENDIIRRLSKLEEDPNHRTVTDIEKDRWNKKADKSYVDSTIASVNKEINSIENRIASSLEARLKQLESALYEDITGNPFTITFSDINGLNLTNGVFNQYKARLEC